jgi:hypothetical protein
MLYFGPLWCRSPFLLLMLLPLLLLLLLLLVLTVLSGTRA